MSGEGLGRPGHVHAGVASSNTGLTAAIEFDPATNAVVNVRHLSVAEGLRRLEHRRALAAMEQNATTEGAEEKRQRELREADVTEAARRSQAEIRRHVDSYLKEHFETVVADVTNVVIEHVSARVAKGILGLEEQVSVRLDRAASEMRAQLRAFARGAWPVPKAAKSSAKRKRGAKKP